MSTRFGSIRGFDDAPALGECSGLASVDGCGDLVFTFDANGCATSVGPGEAGWDASAHLDRLRACLSRVLGAGRFVCLASSTLHYDESCRIH